MRSIDMLKAGDPFIRAVLKKGRELEGDKESAA